MMLQTQWHPESKPGQHAARPQPARRQNPHLHRPPCQVQALPSLFSSHTSELATELILTMSCFPCLLVGCAQCPLCPRQRGEMRAPAPRRIL